MRADGEVDMALRPTTVLLLEMIFAGEEALREATGEKARAVDARARARADLAMFMVDGQSRRRM